MASTATSPGAATAPALDADTLGKSFGGVPVLRNVSFAVRAGEVHALLGQNGAGKSTLIKCCMGAVRPDSGVIRIGGTVANFAGPADAMAAGVRVIHQERSLVPYFDVVENVFLGQRYPRGGLALGWSAMHRAVSAIAADLAPDLPLRTPVSRLSPGQQQMAEILRAFLGRARIVVLDEPTTALGEHDVRRLFDAVRRLRREGTAVVYVSHRLEEVLSLCDRATVLRDGQVVTTEDCAGLDAKRLIALMSGDHTAPQAAATRAIMTPLLRIDTPSTTLTVGGGEIVGLYGLLGSGRSRLLRALFGAVPSHTMRATLRGEPFAPRTPAQAIRRRVVLVPEDRAAQGLVLRHPVRTNVTLPLLRRFRRLARLPWPSRGLEVRFAESMRQRVMARFATTEQPVGRLSGGNQQKLLLGRWLAQDNALYLLDEPTKGIDVGAKAELHDRIRALAAAGAGVLLATSDLPELLSLSDRVVVLRAGQPVAQFGPGEASAAAVLAASHGH